MTWQVMAALQKLGILNWQDRADLAA